VKDGDELTDEACCKVKELWLYADVKSTRHAFAAEFVSKMSREEFLAAYPTYAKLDMRAARPNGRAVAPRPPHSHYYVFKTTPLDYGPSSDGSLVIARAADFGGRSAKVKKAIEQFKADGEFAPLAAYLPSDLAKVPRQQFRVCEEAVRWMPWSPVRGMTPQQEKIESIVMGIAAFGRHRGISIAQSYRVLNRHGVLQHLDEHYEIECCLPIEHIVADMESMCAVRKETGR